MSSLIYVVWYQDSDQAIYSSVASLESDVAQSFKKIIVVLNNSAAAIPVFEDKRFRVVRGSNRGWEFSGYAEGLDYLSNETSCKGVVYVFNDTYLKNWCFSFFSKFFVRRMHKACLATNCICFSVDFFSHSIIPLLSTRTVNSRFFLLSDELSAPVAKFLHALVDSDQSGLRRCLSSIYPRYDETVARWIKKSSGRWGEDILGSVRARITLEHSLIRLSDVFNLKLYPASTIYSYFVKIVSIVLGEKR